MTKSPVVTSKNIQMDQGNCPWIRSRKGIFIILVLISACFVLFMVSDTEKTRTFLLRTAQYGNVNFYLGDVTRNKTYGVPTPAKAESIGAADDKLLAISKNKSIGVTSDKTSIFYIANPERNFSICDQIDVIIEAKDDKNQTKENGGDYFRVRIFNTDLKAGASPDGNVTYIGGGRYKASFTLRWEGRTFVRAILVHPAEAVDVLRRARDTLTTRYAYFGRFEGMVGKKSVHEETVCNVIPPNPNVTTCDLTRSAIEAPWFCTAPSKTGLNCSDFAWTCANSKTAKAIYYAAVTTPEAKLFVRQKQPIQVQGTNFVTVGPQDDDDESSPAHCRNARLPPCSVGIHNLSNPMAAGFFLKGSWYSNYCRLRNFKTDGALKCLRNKTLLFHGDSTTRQYYEYLVKKLRNNLKPNPPTKQSNWKVGPSLAEDKVNNITVRYRHHGYPIRNNWTDAHEVLYIEEALDESR